MTDPIIEVPVDEILETLDHGNKWTKGSWTDGDLMCLHQAVRVCHPQPGDAHIIQQVAEREGWGTGFNDADGTDFFAVEQSLRLRKEGIHDWQLEETFGPQWLEIVALVRRAAVLTPTEVNGLAARFAAVGAVRDSAQVAALLTVRDSALVAAGGAARDSAEDAAKDAARAAAWDAVRAASDAGVALAVRDLIGQHGFTQDHYDTLTGPWRTVIGPIHPDDDPLGFVPS